MAEYNKQRYYWIKLTDHFLTSDTVDFLLSQKNGANYVVLYQMLCLKSVNSNGLLARQIGEIIVPYDVEKIQRDCKHFDIDTVRVALELYKKLGLVYEQQDGILQIADFDRLIGSQTISAEKKQIQIANRQSGARGGKRLHNRGDFRPVQGLERAIGNPRGIYDELPGRYDTAHFPSAGYRKEGGNRQKPGARHYAGNG